MKHNQVSHRTPIQGSIHRGACLWRSVIMIAVVAGLTASSFAQRRKLESETQKQKVGQLQVQPRSSPYTTFFYKNGDLNIEAYFYKPEGDGPFPLVIYNHGSRAGQERLEKPMQFIANVLLPQGYAVLVPERRGYGKSDGQTYGDEVGGDIGDLMMKRFREEASDVIAGYDYLRKAETRNDLRLAKPTPEVIDFSRVAIMGWSHGGVVSLLAASERHEFVALVDQAAGALTWNRSPTLQRELPAAGRKIKIPAICMDAENDATTEAAKSVGQAIKKSGEPETTIIYPPFTPTSNPSNIAPGHLIFAQGVSIWQDDLLKFLQPYLRPRSTIEKVTPVKVR